MKKPIATLAAMVTALTTGSIMAETPVIFDPIPSRQAKKITSDSKKNSGRLKIQRLQGVESPTLRADNLSEIKAYANMWYKADWEYEDASYGVYSFPVKQGVYYSFPAVVKNQRICGNAGAVYANGKYFIATSEEVNAPNGGYVVMSMKFYLFNTETWSYTEIPDADEEFKAMDMAYDPTTDQVYGCFVKRGTNGYYYFGTLDINTGTVKMIKNYGQASEYSFTGVAASDNGTIYAINSGGRLCTINKATGEATTVGETGLADQYMTSAAYEPHSGKIYYALNTDYRQGMYEIDPATAVATKMYDFYDEESVAGMYFPDAPTADNAPGEATSLTAGFTGGSLSGTVSFTAPTATHSGGTLAGPLTYYIKVNGDTKATGTVQPGQQASANITVDTPDTYSISVLTANAAGESTPVRTSLFIGPDTPMPVEAVTLTDNGQQFILSWDAAQSTHGGWLDPDGLAYKITRYPDGTVIAPAHKGTTFSQPRPEPATRTRYHYTVEACLPDYASAPTASNTLIIGNYNPPCTIDFDYKDDTDDFTLIDGDHDGKTWIWADGQMHSSICLSGQVNDYLVLPPIYMQSGKSYRVSFQAKATRSPVKVYPERVALYAGTSRELSSLTTQVIAPTDITTDSYVTLSGDYTPAADGPVHFAILGCSDMDQYYLWVDNFAVSEPVESQIPAPVTNLTATAGDAGKLEATLSFTLPTTDMKGNTLTSISSVEIYRADQQITTLAGTPGQKMTYTDRNAPNGMQTYSVAVSTASGQSIKEHVEVYVGVHEPSPVSGITAVAGDHNGIVRLSWDAPTTDTHGAPLPDNSVTYTVVRYDREQTTVTTGLSTPAYTDNVSSAEAAQEFVQYAVTAVNIAGESEPEYSNTTTYGALHPTPAYESFTEGYATMEFVIERADDNSSWTVTNPASNPGVDDQDADGGFLRFTGVITGAEATFISGSFTTASLTTPALIFHYLYPRGTAEGLSVTVNWEKAGTRHTQTTPATPHAGIDGWQRMIIPLPADADRVQFTLNGKNTGQYATSIFVDNISIVDLPTPNVTLHNLTAPAVVEADQPFNLTAMVENSGAEDIQATVELMLNGDVIDTRTIPLATGEYASVPFTHTLGAMNPAELQYQVRATTDGDRIADDNLSAIHSVGVHHNNLPAPTAANAVTTPGGATVTWTAPDLGPETPVEITDDLEGYVPFSIGQPNTEIASDYIGQWTTHDGDGLYTIGVGHGSMAIPNASTPKAFMAFNAPAGNLTGNAWECHSGSTMFVSFASIADPGEHNDDWLISPRLTGKSQTIGFFARSVTEQYGLEQMEVLYSTTGTAPSDFILMEAINAVPAIWTEYNYYLPEGATYFAIRCTSANLFGLCIDDITFTPCGFRGEGLELTGYKLYRDRQLLTTLSPSENSFLDPAPGVKPTYHVTAIYAGRESRPSNDATLDVSSLLAPAGSTVSIYTRPGNLIIEGADGQHVTVASPDGRIIYAGIPSGSLTLPLGTGTYIVRAGEHATKVALR